MIEGARWLEAAQAAGQQIGGSVGNVATRFRLVGAYALRFQPDLARAHLDLALTQLDQVPDGSRVLLAEAMVGAASGSWACQAFDMVQQLSKALTELATTVEDATVRLFADMIACVAA